MNTDILEWIHHALCDNPTLLAQVEPVLMRARQTYGGDTVYVHAASSLGPDSRLRIQRVTRRTLQRRAAMVHS